MKLIIRPTYHFDRDGEGDAIDENFIVREIRELIGLLNMEIQPGVDGPELRAIKAMTEGATIEQIELFLVTANRILEGRRERALAIPDPDLRKVFGDDAASVGKKLVRLATEINAAVKRATQVIVTGLEPNASERHDAKNAAEVPS